MTNMDIVSRIFSKYIGVIDQIENIESSNNEVYLIKDNTSHQFLIKLYKSESDELLRLTSVELFIYDKLQGCPFIKKIFASGSEEDIKFSISQYLNGIVLADKIQEINGVNRCIVARQLIDFLSYCKNSQVEGYGDILTTGKGKYTSWNEFIYNYLIRMELRSKNLSIDTQKTIRPYLNILQSFFVEHSNLFNITHANLVPADLNLKNIIVTHDQAVKVIDLETFLAGDIHFSLGELMAHTYGTWLCRDLFIEYPGLTVQDIVKIRFYALLSNLSVLLFILEIGNSNFTSQSPWGNPLSFITLIETHAEFLKKIHFNGISFVDLYKYEFFLNEDFGIKLEPALNDRTVLSHETLNNILPIIGKAGITRYPEITELDKTGILAFQCVRPDAEIDDETFTVFSGRGATKDDCMVSALAEAIERFCAEKNHYPTSKVLVGSFKDFREKKLLVHPNEFNIPKSVNFLEDEVLEWIPSVNLIDGKTYYVSANTVFYPYFPQVGRSLFRYFTTGLAAGNTYLEAVSHGLAEVIERDAAAINLLKKANNPLVDENSITSLPALEIINKLKDANLNVFIRYITTPEINVPVFSVLCEDIELEDPLYVSGGYGVNLNKDIALINALNEAALSRVTTISGAREDIKKFTKKRELSYYNYKLKYKNWFDKTHKISYKDINTRILPTVIDDVSVLCNEILQAGFNKVLVVNLSNPELSLPVIKVLVPGTERYSFKMLCIGLRGRKSYLSYES